MPLNWRIVAGIILGQNVSLHFIFKGENSTSEVDIYTDIESEGINEILTATNFKQGPDMLMSIKSVMFRIVLLNNRKRCNTMPGIRKLYKVSVLSSCNCETLKNDWNSAVSEDSSEE